MGHGDVHRTDAEKHFSTQITEVPLVEMTTYMNVAGTNNDDVKSKMASSMSRVSNLLLDSPFFLMKIDMARRLPKIPAISKGVSRSS